MAIINPTYEDFKNNQERALDYQEYRSTWDILHAVGVYFHVIFMQDNSIAPVTKLMYGLGVSAWHEDQGNGEEIHIKVSNGAIIVDNQPIIFEQDYEFVYGIPTEVTQYYVYVRYKYVPEYEPNIAEIVVRTEPETSDEYVLLAIVTVDPTAIDVSDPSSGITVDDSYSDSLMDWGINLAENIAGGEANEILYQTDPNTTGFIDAPTTDQTFLMWDANAGEFVWSAPQGGDADTFDGLDSSQFLRSDIDDEANGKITFLGGGDITTNEDGAIVIGDAGAQNLTEDSDSIQSRNNGNPSSLYLNPQGGLTVVGDDLSVLGDGTVNGDVVIQGNLTVNGDATVVNVSDLEIEDNEILLNRGETGAGVSETQAGIRIDRGTLQDARLIYDDSVDRWLIDNGDGNTYYISYSQDGTGTGLNADTIDGLDSSQFLRSDVDDTANGNITFSKGIISDNGDNGKLIVAPGGARYTNNAFGISGAIKIKLPQYYSSTMIRMEVSIYDYAGGNNGESIKLLIGGYMYSTDQKWYNYFAQVLTNRTDKINIPVRFGDDGDTCCIWIGDTGATWDYLHVEVHNVMVHNGSAGDAANWDDNWSISLVSAYDNITENYGQVQSGLVSSYALNADNIDGINSDHLYVAARGTLTSGDWNTYTTHGVYKVQHTDFSNDQNNPPASYAYGILEVVRSEFGGEDRLMQFYVPHNANVDKYIYQRMYNNGGWTAWQKIWRGGTGAGSGLDADKLDNMDSRQFAWINGHAQTQTASANLSTGWYTVAVNRGDRAVARFGVRDIASSRHQNLIFYASHMYGAHSEITVLHSSRYSGWPIGGIRIKEGGTYDGALLQVYVRDATNSLEFYMLGDNFQASGWIPKPWVPDGTDPGDVNNFSALTNVAAEIEVGKILDGGITTTGQIYATGSNIDKIVLQPKNSGNWVGIKFASKVNAGSDYGYVRWYDDNNDYNFWGDSGENGALVIGVENDPQTSTSDVVALKSPAAVVVDAPELKVTKAIDSIQATDQDILRWDARGTLRRITDQGGILLKADSSIVINAGDQTDVSQLGIDSSTTAEILWLTADNEVRVRSNTQNGLNNGFKEYRFLTNGDFLISNGNIQIHDSNTQIQEGGGNTVRIQTNSGYVDVGPQNGSWSHFYTDRPNYWFNKDIYTGRTNGTNYAKVQAWAYRAITSNVTAISWDYILVDTSGGQVTVTLPSNPANFDKVYFVDLKGTFDSNKLTVARNGKTIMGLAEDMDVTSKNAAFGLIYYNGDWRVVNE